IGIDCRGRKNHLPCPTEPSGAVYQQQTPALQTSASLRVGVERKHRLASKNVKLATLGWHFPWQRSRKRSTRNHAQPDLSACRNTFPRAKIETPAHSHLRQDRPSEVAPWPFHSGVILRGQQATAPLAPY